MGFAIAYLEIPNFFNIPRGASKLLVLLILNIAQNESSKNLRRGKVDQVSSKPQQK